MVGLCLFLLMVSLWELLHRGSGGPVEVHQEPEEGKRCRSLLSIGTDTVEEASSFHCLGTLNRV